MRLDKFLCQAGVLSRRDAGRAIRGGRVLLNGSKPARADMQIDEQRDKITLDGFPVVYAPYVYIWLNKPAGYVSATEDCRLPVVTALLPEALQRRGVFPCGRLDRDTVGWMLLTDDGALSHQLLSPRHHVEKVYRFTSAFPLREDAERKAAEGIRLDDGTLCKSAKLIAAPDRMGGVITLTEGRYHEIKRMLEALDNKVTSLRRIAFGGIPEDTALPSGAWRYATDEEIAILRAAVKPCPLDTTTDRKDENK